MYRLRKHKESIIYSDLNESVSIKIPEESCLGLFQPKTAKGIKDEDIFRSSVENPLYGPGLCELAKKMNAKSACVIISDATRLAPNHVFTSHIINALQNAGIKLANIIFIVAIGVHRDATPDEMKALIGDEYYGKVCVENHTPYSYNNLIYLGDTSYGTPIEVNRRAYECDIHIAIGKVEPHEFAGFSGGRKSVLPGISSEKTILANHAPKMLYMEGTVPGNIESNPIHDDMTQAAEAFRIDFNINLVLNINNEVAGVFSGTMRASHKAAIDFTRKSCNVYMKRPDIIVTTPGIPLNINFYQSLKPLIALTDIIDENMIIALYCQCPDGIDSDDMMEPFRKTDNLDDMVSYVMENYKIQMDHALLLSKILLKKCKIIVCTPNVSHMDLEDMYLIPSNSIDDMMKKAYQYCGKDNPQIAFYPQCQKSVPQIQAV